MKFAIKHANGTTFYEGKPKYNGIFGKPSYLEFAEIASDKPIDFAIGDYVDYSRTGFRYRLYSIPQVEKSSTRQTHGSAFVYKNVQFYAPTKDLEIALFRDLVMYDNTIHFSSIPDVSTYEDVYGIARRIQANLDSQYPDEWTINVVSGTSIDDVLEEVKEFSLSDGTCLDALNQIYELWKGIGWIYTKANDKNVITIGKPNIQSGDITTDVFVYGHDNGIKVLSKAVSSKADFATRVYAYGSDRNMPTRYYNNLSASIKDKQSIYIPHLMLPLTDWRKTNNQYDASKAYLDSSLVGTNGVIPKILRFDGSGDLPDIYPSIEGVSRNGHRIDEVVSASNPTDDGMFTDSSEKVIVRQENTVEAQEYDEYIYPTQKYITCGYEAIVSFTNLSRVGTCAIEFKNTTAYIDGLGDFIKGTPKAKLVVTVGSATVLTKDVQSRWATDGRLEYKLDKVEFPCSSSGLTISVFIRLEADVVYAKVPESSVDAGVLYSYGITQGRADMMISYALSSTFDIVIRDPGFDISEMGTTLSNGLATLSMKDGKCAGRDFQINKCVYNSTTGYYTLTLQRQEDTSLSQWFPNSTYSIASGDHFVLLDMQMPSSYVEMAEQRLHDAALEALQRLSKPKMTYTPAVDSKAVYVSEITLLEGMYMPIQDNDLIETEVAASPHTTWVLIDSMTIAENEDAIPIWSVTLRDEKAESAIAKITGEVTRGNKFIKELQDDGKRRPAGDGIDGNDPNAHPKVYIEAQTFFFVYDDKKQLLSENNILLTAVTEGINNPSFQWYYLGTGDWEALTGETSQTLSVLANSEIYYQNGELVEDFKVIVTSGLDNYESSVRVAKVLSGNGYMVSLNNPAHIFPATESHAVVSSDTVTILAFKGTEEIDVTIGTITGDGDGVPDGMDITVGGTAKNRTVTISVDTDLTQPSGLLYIPVTVVEQVEEGRSPFSVELVYSWALALKGQQGEPGLPGQPGDPGQPGGDGDDGYSSATIYLYQRFPTGSPSSKTFGDTTYTFSTDTLEGSLNGWTRDVPSGDGAVYVTMAHVSSQSASASIAGGWMPNGDWSVPSRLTGDNGRMGKIMRGVNVWDGTFEPTDGWQGINDTDGEFYDVVEYNGSYYYLTDGAYGSQNPASSPYWVEAENFDFIATKVLLADNAFIDILGGNAIYMYGNDGSASGQVVAGIQGGSGDVNGNPQVNFFAGDSNPQDAPFRVYYNGRVVMTEGSVGPYVLDNQGLSSIFVADNYSVHTNYQTQGCSFSRTRGQYSEETNIGSSGILTLVNHNIVNSIDENGISTDGDLKREGEDVVTSPDGALHIEIVTDDYPATLADDTIYIKVQ